MADLDNIQLRLTKNPHSLINHDENVLDESSTSLPEKQYKTDDSYLETPIKEPNWLDNLCEQSRINAGVSKKKMKDNTKMHIDIMKMRNEVEDKKKDEYTSCASVVTPSPFVSSSTLKNGSRKNSIKNEIKRGYKSP
jgi:hypothetical protein